MIAKRKLHSQEQAGFLATTNSGRSVGCARARSASRHVSGTVAALLRSGRRNPSGEKGIALIFALLFVLVLSTLAASLLFLSQSETWSSLNYRLTTQSRYGAEAGLHAAANFLTDQARYGGPGALSAYNTGVSPVTSASGTSPIALGPTLDGVSPNFPVSATANAFPGTGSVQAGNNTVNYKVSAELLSLKQVSQWQCGNAQPLIGQLWKLTAHGDISAVRSSEVEVSALLQSHIVPCYRYAAFATNSGCPGGVGAINWAGGGPIDSYDSSNLSAGFQQYGGNVGSNGNINTAPHTIINGSFSSPETGVGACGSGAALTGSTTQITGCETAAELSSNSCGVAMMQLPQTVSEPAPVLSYPSGVTESSLPTTAHGQINPNNCGGGLVGCYGDISLNGQDTLTLMPYVDPVTHACSAATYDINTLNMSGNNTSIVVGACPAGSNPAGSYQPIIVNIMDVNNSGSPITLTGNSIANPSLNPANLQIEYAGSGPINLLGNSQAAAVVYAPNAPITLTGSNTAWYGSIIGNTITNNGSGVAVHYDRQLQNNLMTVSNWTLDTFTWSKF
jgi:PilX N-terminal